MCLQGCLYWHWDLHLLGQALLHPKPGYFIKSHHHAVCLLQLRTVSPPTQLTVIWRDDPRESLGIPGVWGKIAMLNTRLSRWAWASVALDTWNTKLSWWVPHLLLCRACLHMCSVALLYTISLWMLCSCTVIFILPFVFYYLFIFAVLGLNSGPHTY
jgi:hypothetical protein